LEQGIEFNGQHGTIIEHVLDKKRFRVKPHGCLKSPLISAENLRLMDLKPKQGATAKPVELLSPKRWFEQGHAGHWHPFDPAVSANLDAAKAAGKRSYEFEEGCMKYKVDLDRMTKINLTISTATPHTVKACEA